MSLDDYAASKFFTVFHFAFFITRYFINIKMHFFKIYDRLPFRIISEIFELLYKGTYVKFETSLLFHSFWHINPLNANPTKWSNTLNQFVGNLPTNCLRMFDHFVNLAFKGLISSLQQNLKIRKCSREVNSVKAHT